MNLAVREYMLFFTPIIITSNSAESMYGWSECGRFGLDLDGIRPFPCGACSSIETPTFIMRLTNAQ